MLKRTYTKDEVDALLSTVEAEFFGASLQKAEEELLTKSEGEEIKDEKHDDKEESGDDELEKAYRDLSKDEQKAHFELLKSIMGEDEMAKSEETTELAKSESDLQKEVEELKKSLQAKDEDLKTLADAIKKRFSAVPPQKSVTEVAVIRKSEDAPKEFSKQEITEQLTKKAQDKTLAKSDRQAINQFYKTGSAEVSLIQHLLK